MAPETEMRTNKNGSKEMEFNFFVDFFALILGEMIKFEDQQYRNRDFLGMRKRPPTQVGSTNLGGFCSFTDPQFGRKPGAKTPPICRQGDGTGVPWIARLPGSKVSSFRGLVKPQREGSHRWKVVFWVLLKRSRLPVAFLRFQDYQITCGFQINKD